LDEASRFINEKSAPFVWRFALEKPSKRQKVTLLASPQSSHVSFSSPNKYRARPNAFAEAASLQIGQANIRFRERQR
jgi:uncharacterized membrane protein YfhO